VALREVETLALISTLTKQVAQLQKQVHALARVTVRLTDAQTHMGECAALGYQVPAAKCNCGKQKLWDLLEEVGEGY